MAVKASATITLNSVVDIKATYRYYLLQSSTASKPSKPTSNPPGGSWSDAEPTYTSGSTNSLYFVDLTVFSDDSFSYSEVSKSTSYEAAKEAYNKATNAQNSVDNLEIGGTNMLQYTDTSKYGTGYWTAWGSATITITSDHYIKVTNTAGAKNFGAYGSTKSAEVVKGRKYTVSFDGYADSELNLSYCYLMGTNGNMSIYGMGISPALSTESKKVSFTFVASASGMYSVMLAASNTANYTGGFYFRNLKLEEGNKATTWVPSPKDVEAEIDDASKTAKNFLEYNATNGLQIGNKTGGTWSGFRAQITAGAYNILNAAGTVLASYGEKLIELGKNATDAIIKLCGGKGQIEYVTDEDNGTDYIQMSSDRVRIKSNKMSSVYSMYTDSSTRWEKSAVNVSPTKVEIYASECVDPTLVEHIEGWHETRVDIESGEVTVTTPGSVTFNSEGVYDAYGKFTSVIRGSSGIWSYSKWSDGTVDLWGVCTISNKTCTATLGSMYRTDAIQPNDFPFTVNNPKLTASYESSGYGAILWATSVTTTTKPPSYYLIRPTSATITSGKIIFHVTGTWS